MQRAFFTPLLVTALTLAGLSFPQRTLAQNGAADIPPEFRQAAERAAVNPFARFRNEQAQRMQRQREFDAKVGTMVMWLGGIGVALAIGYGLKKMLREVKLASAAPQRPKEPWELDPQ